MDGFKKFLSRLDEETEAAGKDAVSKNLAKEDALTLIADFVKDVKKKFTKPADKLEILSAAQKTLRFYVDEIENEGAEGFPIGNDFSYSQESQPEGDEGAEPESKDGDFDLEQ